MQKDILQMLWKLNGWPDEMMPEMAVSAASHITVEEMTAAIAELARAGAPITPMDPAVNHIRGMTGIPVVDMDDMEMDAMIGRDDNPDMEVDDDPRMEDMEGMNQ